MYAHSDTTHDLQRAQLDGADLVVAAQPDVVAAVHQRPPQNLGLRVPQADLLGRVLHPLADLGRTTLSRARCRPTR
jgi:hypothetical protein